MQRDGKLYHTKDCNNIRETLLILIPSSVCRDHRLGRGLSSTCNEGIVWDTEEHWSDVALAGDIAGLLDTTRTCDVSWNQ